MGIIIIGGKKASPWSRGVFAPMVSAAPLGDASPTPWDAICMNCVSEVGFTCVNCSAEAQQQQQTEVPGKMAACMLQLGIPAFKGLATVAERDALQASYATRSGCADVPSDVITMARQIADQQTPAKGSGAPKPAASTAASAALPIVAIAAGAGILWWLLKTKKKS